MTFLDRIARVPIVLAGAIVTFLFAGWVLYALEVSESSWAVATVMDVARFFAEPFRFIFRFDDNVLQIAANWGIGAIVYLAVGVGLSRLLAAAGRVGRDGTHGRSRTTA